jgi:hypothetical protein
MSISVVPLSAAALVAEGTTAARAAEVIDAVPTPTDEVAATKPSSVFEEMRVAFDEYLAGFAGIETNLELPECPLESIEVLIQDVAAVGRDDITATVTARVEVMDPQPAAADTSSSVPQVIPIGVVCDTPDADEVRPPGVSGGVYGVGVAAFDYGLAPDIDLSELPTQFPEIVEPSAVTFGFTGYRGCLGGSGGEGGTGTTQCYSWWERDRFVLGIYVTVDRDSVDETIEAIRDVSLPWIAGMFERITAGLPQPDEEATQ